MQVSSISNSDNRNDMRLKAGVIATTALATGCALAHIAKRQGFSLSPSAIKKTPVKDWAVFSLYDKKHPNRKEIELEEKEILELASASVMGGLAGGLLFDDKQYKKSKIRETVNQLLGNVAVPIACVGAVSRLYKHFKPQILSIIPQVKETGKFTHNFNKALQGIPFSIATIVSLGAGIVAGNKVSNWLNEEVFHKKLDRKIKKTDFAPHVDDVGMAVSLMAEKSKGASVISRVVPAFLCVPGYEVGTHRD
jgi:hypothetical protein